MSNHVHLLVTPQAADSVAGLIQSLGRRYVQYVNRFYKRSGTLWEGRYKASIVCAEDYLLNCMRYIELNPVRAGMVADPGEYLWSSYRWNALGQERRFVTEHPLFLALDCDSTKRQSAWRAIFRSELDEEALTEIRESTQKGRPMGSERFVAQIESMIGKRLGAAKRGRPESEAGNRVLLGQLGLEF